MNENHQTKRRKCSHTDHSNCPNGFIGKVVNDVKRIYKNDDDIKFKNTKADNSEAYNPTEVINLLKRELSTFIDI